MVSNQVKNQHLLWRAAFGPMAENANQLDSVSQKQLWKLLKDTSSKKLVYLDVATNFADGLVKGIRDLGTMRKLTKEQRKNIRRQSVYDLKNLNLTWMMEMINGEAQLREKMSLFWHGHFACRVINIYYQQQLLQVIRQHALGNFGDLLRAVSKSAAMLSFLNNQQNKKQHPNENFSREVMELFTMGRGNYTEKDVKESARAYTGWGFKLNGDFVDRKYFHDNGEKTFLGHTGNFDGDDALNIILEQKATARFITEKIYAYFVNEVVDMEKVETLAEGFYQSNYDILQLLSSIFTSDWFYEEKNIGNRIKSPVELMVGFRRLLPLELDRPEMQLLFQRALGQILFYPPNVAGWPGGKSWIDSSSLVFRMRLPDIMAMGQEFSLTPKSDDDVMMGMEGERKDGPPIRLSGTADWDAVVSVFNHVPKQELMQRIGTLVLQSPSNLQAIVLNRYADKSSRAAFIKTILLALASTPEYQLC